MKAQPSSPACPACSKCHSTARFVRSPHSTGGGWQVGVWCDTCQSNADPKHPWWSKSLFTAEALAALPPQPEPRNAQLSLLDASNDNDGRGR